MAPSSRAESAPTPPEAPRTSDDVAAASRRSRAWSRSMRSRWRARPTRRPPWASSSGGRSPCRRSTGPAHGRLPVTTGTGQEATARASASSLKVMRSSNDPPPRTSRMQSGAGSSEAARGEPLDELRRGALALHLRPHADELHERVAPAQRALHIVDDRAGKRGHHRDARAERGIGRLRASSMSPSRRSFSARAATCWRSSPSPASVKLRATKLMRPVGL